MTDAAAHLAVALREPDDARSRVHEALRAERLVGVLAYDDLAAATGQVFGTLLTDAEHRPLAVREDGAVLPVDRATIAARLQRRLDGWVQLLVEGEDEPVESTAAGFDASVAIPSREREAARSPERWVAVLPVPAAEADMYLADLAMAVDGDVVLVPAGGRSLLVCDAPLCPAWPRDLRPVIGVRATATSVGVDVWTRHRLDAEGRARRRLFATSMPDWGVLWGTKPQPLLGSAPYPHLPLEAVQRLAAAEEALVDRIVQELPPGLTAEPSLAPHLPALERLLGIDPPELTAVRVVDALDLPSETAGHVTRELDARAASGARAATKPSYAGVIADQDAGGQAGRPSAIIRLSLGIGITMYLSACAVLVVLAGAGVVPRELTVGSPWLYVAFAVIALAAFPAGHAAARGIARRHRRRPAPDLSSEGGEERAEAMLRE